MSAPNNESDEALLRRIGDRLARLRLARNLTQEEIAEQAGLGLRTVQRLESGAAATQLSGFFRICRVLGLMEGLDAFIPEPTVSPIALLKLQGRSRKRASGRRTGTGGPGKWKWGDDS